MKITVNQLRRIIKEEVSRVLKENPVQDQGPGMSLEAGQMVTLTTTKNLDGYAGLSKKKNGTFLPAGTHEFEIIDSDWAVAYVPGAYGKLDPRYVKQSDLLDAMAMEEMV